MAASSSKNTTPTSDKSPVIKKSKLYDFAFVLKPAKILKNAIDALSDPKLNPDKDLLIKVGPNGFELSVWNVDMITGNEVFAMLQLKAAGLEEFQCTRPFKKMLPLKNVCQVIRAADDFNPETEFVAIFVESGSPLISFQWGTSVLGHPINIEYENAEDEYSEFPDLSYICELSIPSEDFLPMLAPLPDDPTNGAKSVEMTLVPSVEEAYPRLPKDYKIKMEWSFSESFKSASNMSENVTVYLINLPLPSILLGFKLGEVGIMVYLNEAEFISVPNLPIKGHFRSLHPREAQP